MHCPDMLMVRINNSITILVTYFFDVFFPLNISCWMLENRKHQNLALLIDINSCPLLSGLSIVTL